MYLPKLFLYCLKDFHLTGELVFSGQAVHSVTFPHFCGLVLSMADVFCHFSILRGCVYPTSFANYHVSFAS